jgi:hypothetical protein
MKRSTQHDSVPLAGQEALEHGQRAHRTELGHHVACRSRRGGEGEEKEYGRKKRKRK